MKTRPCQELLAICYGELAIDGKIFGENSLTQTSLDPIPFITGFNLSEECFDQSLRGPLVFGVAVNAFSQLKDIRFWVFNRWGELLFFTGDINSKGWDGKHNGKEMPIGSYLYKLIYTDPEDVEYQKSGSFTLVK